VQKYEKFINHQFYFQKNEKTIGPAIGLPLGHETEIGATGKKNPTEPC
jgi:hypothetical protein